MTILVLTHYTGDNFQRTVITSRKKKGKNDEENPSRGHSCEQTHFFKDKWHVWICMHSWLPGWVGIRTIRGRHGRHRVLTSGSMSRKKTM